MQLKTILEAALQGSDLKETLDNHQQVKELLTPIKKQIKQHKFEEALLALQEIFTQSSEFFGEAISQLEPRERSRICGVAGALLNNIQPDSFFKKDFARNYWFQMRKYKRQPQVQ